MTIRETLSKNLALYRNKAGLTQSAAADLLGTKKTTISSWERGISQPSADMLVAIAKAYRVPLSDLCGADYIVEYSPEEKLIIEMYRQSSDQDKQTIQKILAALSGGKQK